jgi:hypothetical protein
MNIIRRIVVAIAAVVIVALAMELVAPKAGRAVSNLFVTVTNTSAHPVPVSGTVAVSTLPTVQVGSISGNLPVTNALDNNNSPIPLVTQNPLSGGNAFDVSGHCAFTGTLCTIAPIYSVPAGKLAVIQSVTGNCTLASSTNLAVVGQLYTAPSGASVESFPVLGPAESGPALTSAGFGGRLSGYASGGAAGNPINEAIVADASQTVNSTCSMEIAGYLVNQ